MSKHLLWSTSGYGSVSTSSSTQSQAGNLWRTQRWMQPQTHTHIHTHRQTHFMQYIYIRKMDFRIKVSADLPYATSAVCFPPSILTLTHTLYVCELAARGRIDYISQLFGLACSFSPVDDVLMLLLKGCVQVCVWVRKRIKCYLSSRVLVKAQRGGAHHHVLFKDVSRSDLGWVVCWMDVFLMLMAVIHAWLLEGWLRKCTKLHKWQHYLRFVLGVLFQIGLLCVDRRRKERRGRRNGERVYISVVLCLDPVFLLFFAILTVASG